MFLKTLELTVKLFKSTLLTGLDCEFSNITNNIKIKSQ